MNEIDGAKHVACGWTRTAVIDREDRLLIIDKTICCMMTSIQSVTCGWKHVLAVTLDGELYSWGDGRHGQLGLGQDRPMSQEPHRVDMPCAVDRVRAGWEFSLAIANDRVGFD